jgi:hypothetical protein
MSRTLTLELPEELNDLLEQTATRAGRPKEAIALEWLARQAPRPPSPGGNADREAALSRLMRHAGAADLSRPTGADNDSIDADLAREYSSSHEDRR